MVNLEQQESNRGTQFLSEYFLGLSDNEIRIHNIDAYLKGVRFGFDPTTNALGAINYTRAPTYAVTSKGRKIGLPPRKDGYAYPRYISSYGQEVLEKAISYVEQGIETGLAQSKIEGTYERPLAIVLPSGMAALTYVLNLIQNMQKKQDISIIVAPNDCYGGTRSLIATSNINVIYAKDCTEAALQVAFDQQNRKTHAILFETLTNPFVRIADTETIVRFAKDHNIITIADSTLAPFSRPLEYGADFNAISLTKYATENNVMLGAVVVNRERTDLFHKLIAYHDLHGSLPGEHEIRLAISTITTMVDSFRIHSKNG